MIVRRKFLLGLVSALAAPAIVPVRSLMAMPRAPYFHPALRAPYGPFWHVNCRCTMIPPDMSCPFCQAVIRGAAKYGPRNWSRGFTDDFSLQR